MIKQFAAGSNTQKGRGLNSNAMAMMRPLVTLTATALAVLFTLVFRGYLLREFVGQTANTFFTPWGLLEAGFVFLLSLCLLAIVARSTRSTRFVFGAAVLYFVSITWPGAIWIQHPGSLGDALAAYTAVYLSQIAVVLALIVVLVSPMSRFAKA